MEGFEPPKPPSGYATGLCCLNQIKTAVTGQGGALLDHIQSESGATVSVSEDLFLCTITISGSQEQINNARLLLRMWCVPYASVQH